MRGYKKAGQTHFHRSGKLPRVNPYFLSVLLFASSFHYQFSLDKSRLFSDSYLFQLHSIVFSRFRSTHHRGVSGNLLQSTLFYYCALDIRRCSHWLRNGPTQHGEESRANALGDEEEQHCSSFRITGNQGEYVYQILSRMLRTR